MNLGHLVTNPPTWTHLLSSCFGWLGASAPWTLTHAPVQFLLLWMTQNFSTVHSDTCTSPVLATLDDSELQYSELWHMYQSNSCYFGWHRASAGFCFNCLSCHDRHGHFQYHKLSFLFLFFILVFLYIEAICPLKGICAENVHIVLYCPITNKTSVLFNLWCVERFCSVKKRGGGLTSIPKFVLYKCCSCCVTTKYFVDAVAVVYIVTKYFADPPKGGRGCLIFSSLESQGCHLIPLSYLLLFLPSLLALSVLSFFC